MIPDYVRMEQENLSNKFSDYQIRFQSRADTFERTET